MQTLLSAISAFPLSFLPVIFSGNIVNRKDFFDFRLLKKNFMARTGKKEELFRCLLCEGGAQKNDADALWNAKKYTFHVR